jgi:hypothetical protein
MILKIHNSWFPDVDERFKAIEKKYANTQVILQIGAINKRNEYESKIVYFHIDKDNPEGDYEILDLSKQLEEVKTPSEKLNYEIKKQMGDDFLIKTINDIKDIRFNNIGGKPTSSELFPITDFLRVAESPKKPALDGFWKVVRK